MIRHSASLARDHSKLIRMNLVKQVGHKMTYFAELVQLFTQGWGTHFWRQAVKIDLKTLLSEMKNIKP